MPETRGGSRAGALTGTGIAVAEANGKCGWAGGRERREGIAATGAANRGSLTLEAASRRRLKGGRYAVGLVEGREAGSPQGL